MRNLVDFIVSQIIDEDAYEIVILEENDEVDIKILVDKDHIAKIIGKSGRIAKAIRTIVKAASNRSDTKYSLFIEEK